MKNSIFGINRDPCFQVRKTIVKWIGQRFCPIHLTWPSCPNLAKQIWHLLNVGRLWAIRDLASLSPIVTSSSVGPWQSILILELDMYYMYTCIHVMYFRQGKVGILCSCVSESWNNLAMTTVSCFIPAWSKECQSDALISSWILEAGSWKLYIWLYMVLTFQPQIFQK